MAIRGLAARPRQRALLIDALGTLVALDPPAPALRELLATRHGVEITESEARGAVSAEIAHYRAHMFEGRDRPSVVRLRTGCAEVLHGALPAPARAAVPAGAPRIDLLMDSLHFSAHDDALGLLLAARAAGVRAVVASNWDAGLPDVLADVGLLELLDGVVTSAVAGAPKPSEEVFRAALAVAGAAPHQAVHVGDDPEADVVGAQAIGIEPILLCRSGQRAPDGVLSVDSLARLPALLRWSLLSERA